MSSPWNETAPAPRRGEPGRLVLIRHGETEWSRTGRHTGSTDIALTENGERQARGLRASLSDWQFAQIRTSPMRRAKRTAELAGLVAPTPIVDPDLCEWDYGDYEGITSTAIHQTRPGWTIFADDAPGGESAEQVASRCDSVLSRIHDDVTAGLDVAIVAHGHVLRVFASRWLGCSPRFGAHLGLDPATLSVLGSEHGVPTLRVWNQGSDS